MRQESYIVGMELSAVPIGFAFAFSLGLIVAPLLLAVRLLRGSSEGV